MRALIVEDSREDALNLRTLLERMPGIEFVAEAHSLTAALSVLEDIPPDVVFLDIELGRSTGFQLLPHLPAAARIILTTIHTDYGPEAFEANAVDYIVKPVTEERLLRALAKLGGPQPAAGTPVQIYRGGSERLFISLESVAAVLADGDHSLVYCGTRRYPDHRRFREWMKLVAGQPFTQLDRSTLVRRDLVHSWTPYGRGLLLKFRNSPQQLELGRAAAQRFLAGSGE
jgi:two-component system, LytTR family, response regulator